MLDKILSPIYFIVGLFVVAKNMTPEQRAEWKNETTTEDRRAEIIEQIFRERNLNVA
jgi:hypothetical protein